MLYVKNFVPVPYTTTSSPATERTACLLMLPIGTLRLGSISFARKGYSISSVHPMYLHLYQHWLSSAFGILGMLRFVHGHTLSVVVLYTGRSGHVTLAVR